MWTEGEDPSSVLLTKLHDPINNTAIVGQVSPCKQVRELIQRQDCHMYFDADYTGTQTTCANFASEKMAPLTAWLKANKLKAMVTEFGAANNTNCHSHVKDLISYMADNPEYIGWTAWAAGPVWGTNSPCCTGNKQWGSLEPGSLAADGSPG